MSIKIKRKSVVIGTTGLIMLTLGNIGNSMGLSIVAGDGYFSIILILIAVSCFLVPCLVVSNYLTAKYRHDGALYYWIKVSFGKKIAFISVWLQWIAVIISIPAFTAFNMSLLAYAIGRPDLANNKAYLLVSSLLVLYLFTFIAIKGIKSTTRISFLTTFLSYLVPITLLFVFALLWMFKGTSITHTPLSYQTFMPSKSVLSSFALLGVVTFIIAGIEMSAYFINYMRDVESYKKAMKITTAILVVIPIIAVISILTLVPLHSLDDKNGIMQAFSFAFHWTKIPYGTNIILCMYFLGQMSATIIMLTVCSKMLEAITHDGIFPRKWGKLNRHGMASSLMWLQTFFITIITILFLSIHSLESAYTLMVVIVGIASILRYAFMFGAGYKALKQESHPSSPIIFTACVCGIVFSLFTFAVSLIPPVQNSMSTYTYEIILASGLVMIISVPLLHQLLIR